MRHSCNANCAGKCRPCTWLNSHAFCSHLVDVMLRPAGHASRLTGDIMQRWVGFRCVLRCKSGLVPNQELLRVHSGWHGINLKAYSSTVYFAYHTFGYYKMKQTTLVLNKGKSNLNFSDARTRICHAVRWPSPTSIYIYTLFYDNLCSQIPLHPNFLTGVQIGRLRRLGIYQGSFDRRHAEHGRESIEHHWVWLLL